MSLVLATLLAAAPATVPACSWDHPGVNPFMGDVVAAVDRYADIPADVRQRLKARMAKRDYDEIAVITRDGITGRAKYDPEIREMHFGAGQICKTVTRSRWTADWQERGLVYCEAKHCIIVPTVCRNVSRINRQDPKVASANGRREEPLLAAKPTLDEGLLANAPLLSTLTPQGDSLDSVANAGGASGWPAWSTGGGASSGGPWAGGPGGGSGGTSSSSPDHPRQRARQHLDPDPRSADPARHHAARRDTRWRHRRQPGQCQCSRRPRWPRRRAADNARRHRHDR